MGTRIARTVGAVSLAITAAAASATLFLSTGEVPVVAWGWIALIALAPLLLLFKPLGLQVLARGILWSNAILGTFLCLVIRDAMDIVIPAFVLLAASGFALVVAGSRPLAEATSGSTFAPKAYRGTILAITVMALADTCTLIFWGGVALEFETAVAGSAMVAAGLVMVLAVIGLARLEAWGFALNVLANLAIAAGIWFVPEVPDPVRGCLVATAVGQIAVGLPLLRALLRGREPEAKMNTRLVSLVTSAMVGALVVASALALFAG